MRLRLASGRRPIPLLFTTNRQAGAHTLPSAPIAGALSGIDTTAGAPVSTRPVDLWTYKNGGRADGFPASCDPRAGITTELGLDDSVTERSAPRDQLDRDSASSSNEVTTDEVCERIQLKRRVRGAWGVLWLGSVNCGAHVRSTKAKDRTSLPDPSLPFQEDSMLLS